jgi:hypothetical protein
MAIENDFLHVHLSPAHAQAVEETEVFSIHDDEMILPLRGFDDDAMRR